MYKLIIFSKVKALFASINIGSFEDNQEIWMLGLINFERFIIFSENLRKNWQIKLATKNLLQPYSEVIKRPRGELIENTVKLTDIGAMFILKWLSYTTRLIIVASLFLTVTIFNPIFS